LVLTLVFSAALVIGLTAPALAADQITVGCPLSSAFLYGWDAERGVKLAVDEINAQGGVNVGGRNFPSIWGRGSQQILSRLTMMSILEKAAEMLRKYPLCDNCLGRQFASLARGVDNRERGSALKLSMTMQELPAWAYAAARHAELGMTGRE
jgi:hypothetical protein